MNRTISYKKGKLTFRLSREENKNLKEFANNLKKLQSNICKVYENCNLSAKNEMLRKYLSRVDLEMDHFHPANTEIDYSINPHTGKAQFLIGDFSHRWKMYNSKKIQFAIYEISNNLEIIPRCKCDPQYIPSVILKRVEMTIQYIIEGSYAWNERIEDLNNRINRALAEIEFHDSKQKIEDIIFKDFSTLEDENLKNFKKLILDE